MSALLQTDKSVEVAGKLALVNTEYIMLLTIGELDRLFVASSSRRGRWYEIIDNKCACEAAEHGLECHHMRNLKAAALAAAN